MRISDWSSDVCSSDLLCFKRGLLDELGIHERLYRLAVRGSFYDFFLEKNNFEIGLSSVLEMELNFGKDIEPLIGRDRSEERREGKECVRPCNSRWSPYHSQNITLPITT